MSVVFFKKSCWELDPGSINSTNLKLLHTLKKGNHVMLVRINKSALVAKGRYLGTVKKTDLKNNRIYITWTDDLKILSTLPVKSDVPVNGPYELDVSALT